MNDQELVRVAKEYVNGNRQWAQLSVFNKPDKFILFPIHDSDQPVFLTGNRSQSRIITEAEIHELANSIGCINSQKVSQLLMHIDKLRG